MKTHAVRRWSEKAEVGLTGLGDSLDAKGQERSG